MKAIITVGISGSGKSTWAERQWDSVQDYPFKVINRDDTRWTLSGKRGWNGDNAYKFYHVVEDSVTLLNYQKMCEAAERKRDIIIADTNLNPKTRNKLIRQCQELGYEVEIKEFPISFPEALKRDAQRGIFAVGEDVLKKQWEQWVQYHQDKGEGMWDNQRMEENNG